MKRFIKKELLAWKDKTMRLPLILRGARQVGKSYIVEEFGKENFDEVVTVNFEQMPQFASYFETLDPKLILRQIDTAMHVRIIPGKTLLFFDEIQYCPRAIMALRYFKEQLPELHVIAAGSLLEFALHEERFSFPVGRVQFLYMRPLSFAEFLLAAGYEKLYDWIKECDLKNPLPTSMHEESLKLVRLYFALGGMPAALNAYFENNSLKDSMEVQNGLLGTYRNDFGKYASKAQFKYLQAVYEKSPSLVGKHFKYTKISNDMRARDLKVAVEQLTWSGLLTLTFLTRAEGIPLRHSASDDKFRLLYLDLGLFQRANQVDPKLILQEELSLINEGTLAEQFVGQELLAYSDCYEDKRLYFWRGESKGSTAEVDFIVNINSQIVPIEVKAGKTGSLRSMHRFLDQKNAPLGLRISELPLSLKNNILSVPFYMIEKIPDLLN